MAEHNNQDTSVFGDEDNNPFPHSSGLASLIQSHQNSNEHRDVEAANNEPAESDSEAPSSNLTDRAVVSNDFEVNLAKEPDHEDSESMLLYQTEREQYNTVHPNYESRVTRFLNPRYKSHIEISEAGKSNEGMNNASKKYVVYTIKLLSQDFPKEEILTRRRYSDFESLRDVLTRIFPLIIIPPIPPKNYSTLNVLNGLVGSNMSANNTTTNSTGNNVSSEQSGSNGPGATTYSYINSNHLNKNRLIEHRKRLFANFLNRCLQIPQIRSLEFFAKFLDPSANWSDEIVLINSQLPKSVYQSNPENGLKTDPIYSNLPLPSSNHALGIPFLSKRQIAKKTTKLLGSTSSVSASSVSSKSDPPNNISANGISNGEKETKLAVKTSNLDDINKKIVENFIGMSNDYVELGTALNSFSLTVADSTKLNASKSSDEDDNKVDIVLDKIGVAFDRSYSTNNSLIAELETKFSEPLGEMVQYSAIYSSVKRFHDRKQKQKELLDEEIKDKRKEFVELARLDMGSNAQAQSASNAMKSNTESQPENKHSSKLKMFTSMGSIKKITKYVSDIMDQNPEQTRKQRMSSLQAKLALLEECQSMMLGDLAYITDELDRTFHSFQNEELKTIFSILLNYNSIFIGWARKNIEIWEEIKEELQSLDL
ncbi:hypothetical protein A9F13_01g02739 [Clavispora lusitaniae]|uniref:PX domain-containing protein n=1 Tax=Clavispora lusitaniae TaxID=36911 RepID=A0AA91Q4M7_CLALS|nr:hypothetical protein A9F13_01g02739 [Clavispora lusitaniae]